MDGTWKLDLHQAHSFDVAIISKTPLMGWKKSCGPSTCMELLLFGKKYGACSIYLSNLRQKSWFGSYILISLVNTWSTFSLYSTMKITCPSFSSTPPCQWHYPLPLINPFNHRTTLFIGFQKSLRAWHTIEGQDSWSFPNPHSRQHKS
jgi:hypothetical protein